LGSVNKKIPETFAGAAGAMAWKNDLYQGSALVWKKPGEINGTIFTNSRTVPAGKQKSLRGSWVRVDENREKVSANEADFQGICGQGKSQFSALAEGVGHRWRAGNFG
jgi:hypothetical protein